MIGTAQWLRMTQAPELKISQGWLPCFVTALLSLLLNAAESSCSPSRELMSWKKPLQSQRLFFIRRGQKIFWYRSFQQLPLIHLSLRPVNITLPVWAHMAQEDVPPHYFPSAQMLPRTTSCPRAVLLFILLKITWKCQVTVVSIHWRVQGGGTEGQQINHWQLDIFVPIQVTAHYSYTVDIDLVS